MLFKLQSYQLDTKIARTQTAGASSEGCEFMIIEPNFDGLEKKCLLAAETLTNTNVNDSSTLLVLENHGCGPIYRQDKCWVAYTMLLCVQDERLMERLLHMSVDTTKSFAATVTEIIIGLSLKCQHNFKNYG